jgi:hypothetical protein
VAEPGAGGEPTQVAADKITFVCCVEYGVLEEGTIRLAESLRRFGGAFAKAPLVAVTPRRGASLADHTLQRFKELDVEYVRTAPSNRYSWMAYTNKYYALKAAEEVAASELVVWIDSDVLVVAPPAELLLPTTVDFAACPRDKNIGTASLGDETSEYWSKVCRDVGLSLDDLPWVRTTADGELIRLYWNAGIFVYRRQSGFCDLWHELIERVLDRTDSSTIAKLFWTDQVALSLAAQVGSYQTQNLSGVMNYGIASHFKEHLTQSGLESARLLHYHDSMAPDSWPWFMGHIVNAQPEVHDWLAQLGPVRPPDDVFRGVVQNAYRAGRQVRRRLWARGHGGGSFGV